MNKQEVVIEASTGTEVMEATQKKMLHVAKEKIDYVKLMEMANMLSKSTIVPIMYQNRPENCFIALDLSTRMGVSPMVVMQNLYIIQGKPSFSGQAIASMVRTSDQFENVELNYVGTPNTDSWGAYVSAVSASTGKILKGSTVTIGIAKKEGWHQKKQSKWQTIPELMLAYRAYAWFGRVYAPEIMMGLHSVEEVNDSTVTTTQASNPFLEVGASND